MKVLFKFAIDFLKNNLRWTITSIFSIMLVITLITTTIIFGNSVIVSSLESAKNESKEFVIQDVKLTPNQLEQVKAFEGLKKIESRPVLKSLDIIVNDGSLTESSLFDIESDSEIILSSGRLPVNNTEVVISNFLQDFFQVKDELKTKQGLYKIVGVIDYTKSNIFGEVFTKSDEAPEFYYSKIAVNDPIKENVNAIKRISQNPHINYTFYGHALGLDPYTGQTFTTILYILCAAIIAVILMSAYFVINNAFSIASTQQITTFSQLFSVGATFKQQGLILLIQSVLVGLIGILLGIVFGISLSIGLVNLIVSRVPIIENFSIQTPSWLIPALIILGMLVVIVSALRPMLNIYNSSLVETLRFNRKFKLKEAPKWVKKQDFVVQFAHMNYRASKKQFNKVLIGLILSIVLFLTTSSFTSVLYQQIKTATPTVNVNGNGSNEQLNLFYNQIQKEMEIENIRTIYNIHQRFEIRSTSPNWNSVYQHAGIQVFDDETFKAIFNSIDYPVIINLVQEYKNGKLSYIEGPIKEPNQMTSLSVYNELTQETFGVLARVLDDFPENVNYFIQPMEIILPFSMLKEYPSIEIGHIDSRFEIKDYSIEDDYIINEIDDEVFTLYNGYENERTVSNLLNIVNLAVNGFVLLITLISLSNIFNTLTTQFIYRAKEFSLLEAVGATEKQRRKIVLFESVITILRSIVWGLIVSGLIILIVNLVLKNNGATLTILPTVSSMVVVTIALIISVLSISFYSLNLLKKQSLMDKLRRQF